MGCAVACSKLKTEWAVGVCTMLCSYLGIEVFAKLIEMFLPIVNLTIAKIPTLFMFAKHGTCAHSSKEGE